MYTRRCPGRKLLWTGALLEGCQNALFGTPSPYGLGHMAQQGLLRSRACFGPCTSTCARKALFGQAKWVLETCSRDMFQNPFAPVRNPLPGTSACTRPQTGHRSPDTLFSHMPQSIGRGGPEQVVLGTLKSAPVLKQYPAGAPPRVHFWLPRGPKQRSKRL
jgi:hypothetical protein